MLSNYAFGQAGLGGLAGAFDKANSRPPVVKKTEEVITPQQKTTPINVERASINDFVELEKNAELRMGILAFMLAKL